MRYTKFTKQNTTQKTKDWDTQSTLNKILHRKLKIEKHKIHKAKYYTENWETQKLLHRKLTIEIYKVH